MRSRPWLLALCSLATVACSKPDTRPTPDKQAVAEPSARASATPQAEVARAQPPSSNNAAIAPAPSGSAGASGPVCTMQAQKIWGTGVNKLTGLTLKALGDGRVGIGFALGTTPHVLAVGPGGEGSVTKIEGKGKVARPPAPAEGTRSLMRVTPMLAEGGKLTAFADYRDDRKDGTRRVVCGPADGDEHYIAFDGPTLFAKEGGGKLSADERKKHFKQKEGDRPAYVELRDCRTFVDQDKRDVWVVGSEVRGVEKPDGSVKWTSTLVLDEGPKHGEKVLYSVDLDGDPPKPHAFEVPASARWEGKGYVLAARHHGAFYLGVLGPNKALKSKLHRYGEFPTLADIAFDGDDAVVTVAVSVAHGQYQLRTARIAGDKQEPPSGLSRAPVDNDDNDSETEPELAIDTRGRRWMTYVEGERDKGNLVVTPVDGKLAAIGKPYAVTEDKERAAEARVVPLKNGDLLVAYIRDNEGKIELVTEDLRCEVIK